MGLELTGTINLSGVVFNQTWTSEGTHMRNNVLIADDNERIREIVRLYLEADGFIVSVVKQIVEKHGGKVSADSRLGLGSIFTVYLPLAE